MSRETEVKIEMECQEENAKQVAEAIKRVHPYETAVIDFIPLVEI